MSKIYRTYGLGNQLDTSKIMPIQNIADFAKPHGGLWACAVESDDTTAWARFVESEDMDFKSLDSSFDFEIQDNARILRLHTKYDYEGMMEYYGREEIWGEYPDFEKILKDFDVIDFKVKELRDELYGWDIDCILVLNPSVIQT